MKKVTLFLTSFLLVALSSFSGAAKAAEQVNVQGSNLQLNGLAVHSELRQEWFLNALYLSSKSDDPAEIINSPTTKRMQIKVLADELPGRRLKRFWIERIKNNNEAAVVLENARGVRELADTIGQDLAAGDTIDIDYVPGQGTVIQINGATVNTVDEAIFPLMLNTWVGERPPSSEFKDAILGNQSAVGYSDLLAKYSTINPAPSRVSLFDQAAQAAKEEEERKAREAEERRLEQERREEEARRAEEERQRQAELAAQREQEQAQQAAQQQVEKKPEPKPEVKQPEVVEVPAGPTEEELEAMRVSYNSAIRAHYVPFFEYPVQQIMRRHGKSALLNPRKGRTHGEVTIQLEVDRDGELVGGSLVSSSGEKILDDAVMSALFDAVPYPAMPEELPEETFNTTLPISIPAPQM
ncbi:TonB family protein [Kangiella sp.]|uniref:TonB family protein n=1 Tax=Kangiella sp. TaxID=1920245 RepID=UPI00198B4ECA|nr:TonB family protein [Kangiella sp.]MBD3653648.1 TonB family protein [Kangiella sp.]